ncbi:ABC transporter permease [Horticoccus luteus]|uniref:ABC transporter permease n=1 Tax=Horticoccus luteus TaxID=2862869 RepID=A0A8F9XMU8_9BACT|nr:ABC transporter permease [Horticoccus luteus]QYM80666.1 ABC transporter permease [Horticoccus luteus]
MFLESFAQDVRVGLRVLVKEKGFCALAAGVLALGIAAVATQFAVVDGVLLRGFAFHDPEQLTDVQLVDPTNFSPSNFNSRVTTADFAELKEQQRSFSAFVAYLNGSTVNLTYNGHPQRLQGGYITYDFFRALGVAPSLGRDFLPEDDRPGVTKAVILGDALWKRDFGGDPGVIGQTVRVNGRAGVIVGVMPPKFAFPANEQLWIPVNTEFPVRPRNDRNINFVSIIGRLKPGVSLAAANAEMMTLARHFSVTYPENKQFSLGWVRPLIGAFTGPQLSGLLYTMLAFCLGVLLIACVNVMNMQFARATLRAKELAVRSSLGATRIRLIRQMLTESLLLAAIGAVVGIALAAWSIEWVDRAVHNLNNPIPAWMTFHLDLPVLVCVVGATVFAAVISGLLPALMASRANAGEVLKESGRGNTGRLTRVVTKGLVVFQIVVTCILLIGSLLQLQSILRQQRTDYGYDTSSVLSARLGLMEGDYPTNDSRLLFYDKLLRELRATSGVESAAFTNRFQMVFAGNGTIEIEGREYKTDQDRPRANFENVTDGYFATLGQRLLAGRDFTMDDTDPKNPVAIVNTTFAQKFFGHESPLGRRFRPVGGNGTIFDPWRTIVGVVSDVRMLPPFNNPNLTDNTGFYTPFNSFIYGDGQPAINGLQFATIVVKPRGGGRPEAFDAALRRAVNRIDPNLPLYFVGTPKTNIDAQLSGPRVIALMFTVFGAIAIILASVGLYGVTSFSVNQRTQEFGIRMALGADHRTILRMVLRQGAAQIGLGLALGILLALAIALIARDGITNFLFQISPHDPLTYTAVALLLAGVSLLATLIPARRATRVDPMVALRAE